MKKKIKKASPPAPSFIDDVLSPPVFGDVPTGLGDAVKLSVTDAEQAEKKAIRRNALEIKEAEQVEENKKSKQEEEWEIPAFLRKVKIK